MSLLDSCDSRIIHVASTSQQLQGLLPPSRRNQRGSFGGRHDRVLPRGVQLVCLDILKAEEPFGLSSFLCSHFHNYWFVPSPISRRPSTETFLRRWLPFDPSRNFPDLGPRFIEEVALPPLPTSSEGDLSWATVLKRTFEKFIRGQAPNLYGEEINWEGE